MSKGFYDDKHTPIRRYFHANDKTANFTMALPADHEIKRIFIKNRTVNAITGGLRVGTSAAGTQIVTAQAVAASLQYSVAPTIPGILATDQILYIETVTAWNSAKVDVVVECLELPT